MKHSIIVLTVALAAASTCLAQSDSTKPIVDSAKVKVQVQQTANDSTTVTVTTEPGKSDSTTVVAIRSGSKRNQRPRWRRNWVIGLKTSSIANLPGSLFLQRMVGRRIFVGCGFDYTRNPSGLSLPNVSSSNYEYSEQNSKETNSYSAWSFRLTTECLTPLVTMRSNRLLSGISIDMSYGEAHGNYCYLYHSGSDTNMTYATGKGKYNSYSASIPIVVERRISIRKRVFYIGLQNALVALDYSKQFSEGDSYHRYYGSPPYSYHSGLSWTYPLRVTVRNPFQNNVSLLIKWYI